MSISRAQGVIYAHKRSTAFCAQMLMELTNCCAVPTATATRHNVTSTRTCGSMSSLPTGFLCTACRMPDRTGYAVTPVLSYFTSCCGAGQFTAGRCVPAITKLHRGIFQIIFFFHFMCIILSNGCCVVRTDSC